MHKVYYIFILAACAVSCWSLPQLNMSTLTGIAAIGGNIVKKVDNILIVPGTKWCGRGVSAKDYNDLGTSVAADKCCREHKNCSPIRPGNTYNGIKNTLHIAMYDCGCEKKFRHCLQIAKTLVANTVGYGYFAAYAKCYGHGYPIVECKVRQPFSLSRRCLDYTVNETEDKVWQVYDNPLY